MGEEKVKLREALGVGGRRSGKLGQDCTVLRMTKMDVCTDMYGYQKAACACTSDDKRRTTGREAQEHKAGRAEAAGEGETGGQGETRHVGDEVSDGGAPHGRHSEDGRDVCLDHLITNARHHTTLSPPPPAHLLPHVIMQPHVPHAPSSSPAYAVLALAWRMPAGHMPPHAAIYAIPSSRIHPPASTHLPPPTSLARMPRTHEHANANTANTPQATGDRRQATGAIPTASRSNRRGSAQTPTHRMCQARQGERCVDE